MNHTILLTFDIEDWFQVENFKQYIPFSSWPKCELRVEKNVHKILDLLDSINCNTGPPHHRSTFSSLRNNPTNSKNVSRESASRKGLTHNSKPATHNSGFGLPPPTSRLALHALNSSPFDLSLSPSTLRLTSHVKSSPKATFFVLGWIAERLPHLVREIQARGHEIASHGYGHELCREQSTEDLKNDLVKSKNLLEDITGEPVYGYRAPSFSINDHILQLIRETGYLYDSSFNSFGLHGRYGRMKLNGNGRNGILYTISDNFFELPVSNLKLLNRILPWGGGGYFRLIPLSIFKQGVDKILKKQEVYLFYLHPWEVDSDQPKVSEIPRSFKFRHYVNLDKTYGKLSMFLGSLKKYRFLTCFQYVTEEPHQTR